MHAPLTTDEPFNGEDNWYFSFKNCTTLIPEIRMNKLLLCQIAVIILISSLQGEWTGLYYSPNPKIPILLGCDKRSLSPSGERCLRRSDGPGAQFYHTKDLLDISWGTKLHPRKVEAMTSSWLIWLILIIKLSAKGKF